MKQQVERRSLAGRLALAVFALGVLTGGVARADFGIPGIGNVGGSFGTKFACCRSESVSCLGGGGATVWHTMLRDRALTQVDAQARCGVYTMRWATHSCPASTACSGLVPDPITPPPPPQNRARVRNDLSVSGYVVVKKLGPNNQFLVDSWFEVRPGQTREFTFPKKACIGYSVNGVDRIRQRRQAGVIFTGEISETWVHPTKRTDMGYGQASDGRWYINMDIGSGATRYANAGMSVQAVAQTMANYGLVKYQCLMAGSGTNHMFID